MHRSENTYRKLLRSCPREFRQEYGSHMEQAFADLCREKRYYGAAGLVRLWMRVLPDLALTAISERSKAVGKIASRAGRLVSLKSLMVLNGVAVILFGFSIIFPPGPGAMLDLYEGAPPLFGDAGTSNESAYISFARFFAVTCVSFGALLLAVSSVAESRAKTVSGWLCVTYALGALIMYIQQITILVSTVGWITFAVHLFFALGYGAFFVAALVSDIRAYDQQEPHTTQVLRRSAS